MAKCQGINCGREISPASSILTCGSDELWHMVDPAGIVQVKVCLDCAADLQGQDWTGMLQLVSAQT
jgi:hypothetical protein